MLSYVSTGGKELNATGYTTGRDYIIVEFQNKAIHKYTYLSAGSGAVEAMKQFAVKQAGLSTYIDQNKPAFASKS